jgi:hypothetical protein
MKTCAFFPAGAVLYKIIQKTFGRLKANPMSRIPLQILMVRWILDISDKVEGMTFFEVGTRHDPIVPIAFFYAGKGDCNC